MYLYALYGLRGSVGVLRVYRCKYSHLMAFNLCALKFCKHAMIRSARKTPGEVRPDSIAGAWRKIRTHKPAQRYILHLCNMPAICNRSAQTISTRPESPRNRSPKISRPMEIKKQASKLWNREISDQNPRKNFLMVVGILGKQWGVQILPGQNL